MPRIDAIMRSLSEFDLDGLKEMYKHIIKTTVKNKVFRSGTIDGVELFESTQKCCNKCLSRVCKDGRTHYFHRIVVCTTIGSDSYIILGQEMLEPKKDSSDKDEGELTGGKRLIKKLYKEHYH